MQVLIQGQIYTTRAKGNSAFLVLREAQATVQVNNQQLHPQLPVKIILRPILHKHTAHHSKYMM